MCANLEASARAGAQTRRTEMARHVVIEIDTDGEGGWEKSEEVIAGIVDRCSGLPVLVIRPSHGGTRFNPRVESVGWTDEDRRRAL